MGHVFAIIRVDDFLGDAVPIEHRVTVKEIVCDAAEAAREVERLNSLRNGTGVRYFSQITRMWKLPGDTGGVQGGAGKVRVVAGL